MSEMNQSNDGVDTGRSDTGRLDTGRVDWALERKVARSKWAIFLERVWPRVWLVVAVGAAFVLISMLELWVAMPRMVHVGVLAAFGLAFLASLVFAFWVVRPSRDAAIARMERTSGIKHRPASSYEDTLTSSDNPETRALWRAHRSRLARLVERLKVSRPQPQTHRLDPFALRAMLLLGLVGILGLGSGQMFERVAQAFEFRNTSAALGLRIDAWVAPPSYTGRQPIMLADGGKTDARVEETPGGKLIEVPANSELIVRAAGTGSRPIEIALEVTEAGGEPREIAAENASRPGGKVDGVVELRYQLQAGARVRLLVANTQDRLWTFAVKPDALPVVELSKKPSMTRRGSMKLSYAASDDYGLASLIAKVKKAPANPGDPQTSWARKSTELSGPRLPLTRPPELPLRLPRANAEGGKAVTNLELAAHPWAGLRVVMTLEAVDVAGQIGRSKPFEVVLPQRRFQKPFARAVIEQRRKLAEDSRYRPHVVRALEALTVNPERFIEDVQVYLGLRTALHRLEQNNTRKALSSVIDQLWHVAVRIEDGDLSDAERRLREAQEKLAKALQDGASDEEIKDAMDELRQALNDYLQQLQKQAKDNPLQQQQDQSNSSLSKQELDRMMQDLENQALNGSREKAEQMLSELRDLLDRIDKNQSSKMSEQQRKQQEQAMRQMEKLGDLIGKQQKLMDDTFQQQRQGQKQGQKGGQKKGQQQGQQKGGQQGRQGQSGRQQGKQSGKGQRGKGQRGAGRQGQQGQQGRGQPSAGAQRSPQELMARQRELTQQLDALQRELSRSGRGSSEKLGGARKSMDQAEQALSNENYDEAARQQANALEQMRDGAQKMAEEMSENGSKRAGNGKPGDPPRDPLGRPQRAKGPQLGTSVKVPDKIDMQRAREILQELRKRLSDPKRREEELDYFERLLRRF